MGSKFLDTVYCRENFPMHGCRVLELGAGTGLVGLAAAALYQAQTVITDLQDLVPLIERNIKLNGSVCEPYASARTLKWGERLSEIQPQPDYILLADCIYYAESLEPLVTTITELSSPSTTVLMCYEERTFEQKQELQKKFFHLISERFVVNEIPQDYHDMDFHAE